MTRLRCLSRYSIHPDYADDPDIPAHAYEAARIELGAHAPEDAVTARALEIVDGDLYEYDGEDE